MSHHRWNQPDLCDSCSTSWLQATSAPAELLQVLQRMDEGATRRGHRQVSADNPNRRATQQLGHNKQFNQPQTNTNFSRGANERNTNNSNSNWRSKPKEESRARVQQISVQNANEDFDAPRENDDDHETSGNEL